MTTPYIPCPWELGHPEHWRDIIERMDNSRPPALHEVELGGCKWCGRNV